MIKQLGSRENRQSWWQFNWTAEKIGTDDHTGGVQKILDDHLTDDLKTGQQGKIDKVDDHRTGVQKKAVDDHLIDDHKTGQQEKLGQGVQMTPQKKPKTVLD